MDELGFTAEVWRWDGQEAWFFATLPQDVTEQVREVSGPRRGFGSVKVEATATSGAGETVWCTSVFPDSRSGRFLLPLKRAIRQAHDLDEGDSVDLRLTVVDEHAAR